MKNYLFLFVALMILMFTPVFLFSQVYYESVGNGTSEVIAEYTGWDNQDNPDLSYAEEEPTYSTLIDASDQDYEGTSGGSAIWVGGGDGTNPGSFTIMGLNTAGHPQLTMTFGMKINAPSAIDFTLEYSDDMGETWNTLTMNNVVPYNWTVVVVNNVPSVENLYLKWINNTDVGWQTLHLDDIRIFNPVEPEPTITLTGVLEDFGETVVGTSSPAQSYSVTGHTLTEGILITPPEGYEISLQEFSGYSPDPLLLPQTNGMVNPTTIYVKFSPAATQQYSGDIQHESSGATPASIAVSGTGTEPVPFITLTGSIQDFGNLPVGNTSEPQSYMLEAIYLADNLTVLAPAGFEISLEDAGVYDESIELVPADGVIDPTTIYVRFAPPNVMEYSSNITHTSTNSNNPLLAVSGTGISTDPVIMAGTVGDFGNQVVNIPSEQKSYFVEAYNLTDDLSLSPAQGFEVSLLSGENFTAQNPLVLTAENGTVSPVEIFVRFIPTEPVQYTGVIQHVAGLLEEAVAVSGTGTNRQLHRARIVDFGGDHGEGYYRDTPTTSQPGVAEDVDGDGSTNDDGVAYWRYSYSDPFSPSAIHYDRQATSSIFYGGMTGFFDSPGFGLTEGMVNENHELRDDHNFMVVNSSNTVQQKAWGVYFWKKENFLNGGAPEDNIVSLDENSLLAVHISRYWTGMQGGRFVVENNGQFYISEFVFTDALRTTVTLVPTETHWAEYNPEPSYHVRFDPEGAVFQEMSFQDVDAVGFYLFDDILDSQNIQVKWHSFEAWATIEREPTAGYYSDVFGDSLVEVPSGAGISPFFINRNEVSYALWQKVYKWAISNQFCFGIPDSRGYVFDRDGDMGSMDYNSQTHTAAEPATDMTWYDAVLWCNALSELEGLEPCYYSDAGKTQRLKVIKGRDNPTDYANTYPVYVDWTANGYRLPTIDEWVNAAAGGNSNSWTGMKNKTAQTGASEPNTYGIYDMSGNVWEYVWDIQGAGDYYNPDVQNSHTVMGGSYITTETPEFAVLPYGEIPFTGNHNIGFRVIRSDEGSTPPSDQNSNAMPAWEFTRETILIPETPKTPIDTLVAQDLVYMSGDKVFGQEGSEHYEDDCVGYTRGDEAPITITPYYASKYEITYAKWNEVYQWAVNNGYDFDRDGDMGSMDWNVNENSHQDSEPVTDVGWNDVALWCNALSEYEGLTPVYYTDTVGESDVVLRQANQWRLRQENRTNQGYHTNVTTQFMAIIADYSKDGYRLPTEAEWDYLLRDGDEAQNFSIPSWAGNEWLSSNSNDRTHEVGTAPSGGSGFGFYDLGGNVEEWIWDWIGRSYYISHNPKGSDDPDGLFGKGLKGSSFGSDAISSTTNMFRKERESAARPYLGFRVVRCDAGEHPETNEFIPAIVLDFDPMEYDPLEGQTFRNNLHRTGAFDKTGVPEGPVELKWSVQTGGAVKSSPVLVDGVLYVGSSDGYLYALNAASGEEIWKYSTGSNIESSATIADDILYIGDQSGYLHAIYIRGEAAGTRKWRKKQSSQGGIPNTASVVYNTIFASWTGWANESRGTGFDLDGNEVWRFRALRLNGGPAGMAVDTFAFYQPARDNLFVAGDLATEMRLWNGVGIHGYNFTPIANHESIIYADESQLIKSNRETGARQWYFARGSNTDSNQFSSPAVGSVNMDGTDTDVVIYAQLTGKLWAVGLDDGAELWENNDASLEYESSPSLAQNRIYVGNNDNFIYGIDAQTGNTIWSFETDDKVFSTPLPHDGVIYCGSDDGKIYALYNSSVNSLPTIDIMEDATISSSDENVTLLATGISDGDDGTQQLSLSVEAELSVLSGIEINDNGDGTASIPVSHNGIPGSELVTITVQDDGDVNNTFSTSFFININMDTGLGNQILSNIKSYPNPVSNRLFLELENDVFQSVMIMDMQGNILHSEKVNGESKSYMLIVDQLAPGFYIVSVEGNNEVYNIRIVVN